VISESYSKRAGTTKCVMTLDVKGIFTAGKIKFQNHRHTVNDKSLLQVYRMVHLSHLKCVKEKSKQE
jgi:hypothetical protein